LSQNGRREPTPRPVPTKEELAAIRADLELMSRRAFIEPLANALACAPTPEAIIRQAERFPDRWGQLLVMLARLVGYHEKVQVDTSLAVRIGAMSDAEVEVELERVERELQAQKQAKALPAAPDAPRPEGNGGGTDQG
jgi:hypothetical protein